MAKLNINGKVHDVQVEDDTPLLWVIREQVGLTGTKYGCGVAQCGACSVHINGEVRPLVRLTRSSSVKPTDRIVTIEGLSPTSSHPVQRAWAAARCAAMRLLPVGPDHGGSGAARQEPKPERRGDRRSDDQHLPLRNVSAHPRGDPHSRAQSMPWRRSAARSRDRGDRHDSTQLYRRLPIVRAASSSSAPPPPAAGSRSGFNLPFGIEPALAQARRRDAAAEVNAWVVVETRRDRA